MGFRALAFQHATHKRCIHAPALRIYERIAQRPRACRAGLRVILRVLLIGVHDFPFKVEKVSLFASV